MKEEKAVEEERITNYAADSSSSSNLPFPHLLIKGCLLSLSSVLFYKTT